MQRSLPKTLPAFFWHFIKKHLGWLLLIQFFCFGWSMDQTLWPYVTMLFIDGITNFEGDRALIWSVLATPLWMGGIIWVLVDLSFRFSGILIARVFPRLEASIRLEVFDYVQRHSYSYFGNQLAGDLANKIGDITQNFSQLLQKVMGLFLPVFLAFSISIYMFTKINLFFALILAVWVLLHISICFLCARRCDEYSNTHAKARSLLSGKIVDSLTNHINVKLFSRYSFEKSHLEHYQNDERQKNWQSMWYMERMKLILGIACFLGSGVALTWYILHTWQKGELTAGEVVFIFNTNWNISLMTWLAGLELPNVFREIGVCRQALTMIQKEHDIQDSMHAKELKVGKGEITFENVSFGYVENRKIFENKSITLKAGEKIGVVGFSGSGKTTFFNLILRYFDINKGRILIDGQDITSVTQKSLREQIAVIPQDPCLFHRSLIDNIRYGKLDATEEEIIDAAKKAHCHEFVQFMPEQYHSLVGERGLKLSGGQRQRIAIARAILKNAPILILDEATSALDSVTEKLIQDGLEYVMKGRTTLVIAHRLSTLADMDRILVFDKGQIIEEGTHMELLQKQGHYARLWDMQAGGFLPEKMELEASA